MPATDRAIELATTAAEAASDKIATTITGIDVSGHLPLTDVFLIVSARGDDLAYVQFAGGPDDIAAEYGADTLRLYEMYMGPLDQSRPWATKDVVGLQRFLQRAWRLVVEEESGAVRVADIEPDDETLRLLHKTIAEVREDYNGLRDNIAVAALIGPAPVLPVMAVLLAVAFATATVNSAPTRSAKRGSISPGPFPQAPAQSSRWLRRRPDRHRCRTPARWRARFPPRTMSGRPKAQS